MDDDAPGTLAGGQQPTIDDMGWTMPAAPLFKLSGERKWASVDLPELWAHRDVFFFLAWRDVKVRYKQTVLGVLWAVLQPLLTMIVFTLLFGRLAHVPSDGLPYAVFSYTGLLLWNFFSSAVSNSAGSLLANSNLLTKVYFPRMLLPAATVAAALMDFAIAALLLLGLLPWYGVGFSLKLIALPLLAFMVCVVAFAVGMGIAALSTEYRDLRYALPFALQLWMFLTPVIYPVSFVPARWRWLLMLNPLSGTIDGLRAAVAGRALPWGQIAGAGLITLVLLAIAISIFKKMEREFADII